MSVIKKPDLTNPVLRAKLAKGMGHNYYGEPAWPNDLLYIFPVVILGTFALVIGLSILEPSAIGEKDIKRLRPKVKMGGSVTRNGVNVDKEIEKQTALKHKKQDLARKMKQ